MVSNMRRKPFIVVRLVQIQGPLENPIMEFSKDKIFIGRAPHCDVCFHPELDIISKIHAEIARDGNCFKLIDHSTNGTFVWKELIRGAEKKLKDGDVLTLADLDDGPKISFLMEVMEDIEKPPEPETEAVSNYRNDFNMPDNSESVSNKTEEHYTKSVSIPFRIIYGINFKSFETLPIIIGRNQSDFLLNHPEVLDFHAEIFFSEDQYWIKDLTGRKMISVNEQLVDMAPLNIDDLVSLSPHGPRFRFLEGGCLQSVEAAFQKNEVTPEKKCYPEHSGQGKDKKGWLGSLFSK